MPAREEYAREFYKNFKNVDPDHDWNQAQKSSVTVKTSRPSSIKVMADIKGKRYLFADYREASGSNEIPLTLPKSVTDIIVKVNGQNFPAKLGATVDASSASSRIINGKEDDFTEINGLEWKIVPERIFATIVIQDFLTIYAEDDPKNLSKGTNSFYFIADGKEHTFFPFYWWTNRKHCLGIYVVDDNDVDKITLHDLYFSRSGELYVSNDYKPEIKEFIHQKGVEVRFNDFGLYDVLTGVKFCGPYDENDWKKTEFPEKLEERKTYTKKYTQDNAVFKTDHGYISRIDNMFSNYIRFYRFYETPTETYVEELNQKFNAGTWQRVGDQPAYHAGPNTYVRTRGITYRLPEGKRYGFYLKMLSNVDYDNFNTEDYEYDFIVFSNADRNKKQFIDPKTNKDMNKCIREYSWTTQPWWKDSGADESDEFSYASWGKAQMYGSQYTLFGFEDWQAETNNVGADMNDIMFLFAAGEEPTGIHDTNDPDPDPDPKPESYQWIIAAEDLGGSYDWDFNDVVAGVSIQAMKEGEKEFSEVTVTPLASGGTLPVYFMYTGKIVNPETGDPIANSNGDNYVIGGEFHSLFGKDFGSYINASKDTHIKADPITFYTPAGHSLASSGHVHYDGTNMGGFCVLAAEMNSPLTLQDADEYGLISIDLVTATGVNKITNFKPIADKALTAPQIICVEAEWAWPLEEKNIKLAYPEFETWVENAGHNEWIKNKKGELTVNR